MDELLRKKYIPMTETIYYTLLSVTVPRHGYAIMRHVSELTKGRLTLGTGTLYTMVGRLTQDGVIAAVPGEEKKTYRITEAGMELLGEETKRLVKQLSDGITVLGGGISRPGLGRRAGLAVSGGSCCRVACVKRLLGVDWGKYFSDTLKKGQAEI